LRERPGDPVAVILLTARGEESDRLVGLRRGADDYVVKPFSPAELVARVDAVLRRLARAAEPEERDEPPIERGALRIEPATRRVFLDGEELMLTQREFDLLAYLAERPGRVFSRDQLMDAVWEYPFFNDTSTVTVHVRRLRAKLGDDPAEPRFIETVWGVGYRLRL
jgi:DNA-binding response OmpR family regulator